MWGGAQSLSAFEVRTRETGKREIRDLDKDEGLMWLLQQQGVEPMSEMYIGQCWGNVFDGWGTAFAEGGGAWFWRERMEGVGEIFQ